MQVSYFREIRSKIIPYLDGAKSEVTVAMAWFTSEELFNALLRCLRREINVELVLLENEINFMYYAPDFNDFIESGGILRIAQVENGFMHHKFCIIDNKYVITGSYNWTYYAETRNMENIIISDDPEIVYSYRKEFSQLSQCTDIVKTSPRIDWSELAERKDVDFGNLNYEIEIIARERQLPNKTVVKSTTTVSIEDRPLTPVSKYNIGISTDKDNIVVLIPSGTPLPYVSEKKTLYNYSDERDGVSCIVVCEDGTNGEKLTVTERDITDITNGRKDFMLKIELQFNLMPNGDLLAEVRCLETAKVMSVKTTDLAFIKYVE